VDDTELTDEPCPECGVAINIVAAPVPASQSTSSRSGRGERARRKTLPQTAHKVCPACGWTVPA
jgi:hypothetical protein